MSTSAVDVHHAEHYTWGKDCDGWHLVKTPELSIILERMPPHSSEVRHSHARSRQFFFVLEGELSLEVEGEAIVLQSQQGLEIAPGQVHQAVNLGQVDVRFVVVSQPPSHGDRTPIR